MKFSLFSLLLLSNNITAQLTPNEQRKNIADREKYEQRYLDLRTPPSSGNPKYGTFKNITEGKYISPEESAAKEEERKRRISFNEKERRELTARVDAIMEKWKKEKIIKSYTENKFYQLGLDEYDVKRLTDLSINYNGEGSPIYNESNRYIEIANIYKFTKTQINTLPFEVAINNIIEFDIIFDAAKECLDLLEKRFPEKKEDIELTYLQILPSYFKTIEDGVFYSYYEHVKYRSTPDKITEGYFTLITKYPKLNSSFLKACGKNSPFECKVQRINSNLSYNNNPSKKEIKQLNEELDQLGNLMFSLPDTNIFNHYKNIYAGPFYFKLLWDFTKIKELSKLHQHDMIDFIVFQIDGDLPSKVFPLLCDRNSYFYGKEYELNFKKKKGYDRSLILQNLKDLAATGDEKAITLLTIFKEKGLSH